MRFFFQRLLLASAWSVATALTLLSANETPAPKTVAIPPAKDRGEITRMFDSWKAPVPPRHLVGNIYYVGAIGVSSFLITTPEGHILLDSGFDETEPIVENGVRQLGFKVADIKILLSSHAHLDHTGGHARLKRLTGAQVVASEADARILESGGTDDFIPIPKDLALYPPVKVDRVVRDGEQVTLGGVTLTAHLTPGHTKGATTWTMDIVEDGRRQHVVFFSSASINAGTKLIDNPLYPEIAGDLTKTFARLKSLPCDLWFAPHGGQFAMAEKFERLGQAGKANPFIDPDGWHSLIEKTERAFLDQLAAEKKAAAKPE
jgi:metallo-beta-lactamase class B